MALAPWVLLPLVAAASRARERRAARAVGGGRPAARGGVNAVASLAPSWCCRSGGSSPGPRAGCAAARRLVVRLPRPRHGVVVVPAAAPRPVLPAVPRLDRGRSGDHVGRQCHRGPARHHPVDRDDRGRAEPVWPAGLGRAHLTNAILFGLVVVLAGLLGLALGRATVDDVRPRWAPDRSGPGDLGHVVAVAAPLAGTGGRPARRSALALPQHPQVRAGRCGCRSCSAWRTGYPWPCAGWPPAAPWPGMAPAVVVLALDRADRGAGLRRGGPAWPVPGRARAWARGCVTGSTRTRTGGGRSSCPAATRPPGCGESRRTSRSSRSRPSRGSSATPCPSGPAAATRILDEIEARVAQGRGGPGCCRSSTPWP